MNRLLEPSVVLFVFEKKGEICEFIDRSIQDIFYNKCKNIFERTMKNEKNNNRISKKI